MRTASAGALALAVALLAGCAAPQPPAVGERPAATSYTAETTYAKLAPKYPFIRIASREVPAGVEAVRDVTYVRRGERDLRLDLYLPAQRQDVALPAIVFVHGGGWRVGVRDNFAPMAIRMAQRGYAAATITYRLADDAPYPAAVQDARAAVRWLRAHAAQYAVDPGRIAIAGGSAGGQIASLAGVAGGIVKFDPGSGPETVPADVQAIVNIDGVGDFEGEVARLRADPAIPKPAAWSDWFGTWFRGPNDVLPTLWREASPLTHVGPDTPPMLFIGSGVPRFSIGRESMVKKLHAAGVASEVKVFGDTPHSFWLFDPWLQATVEAADAFLQQHLSPR